MLIYLNIFYLCSHDKTLTFNISVLYTCMYFWFMETLCRFMTAKLSKSLLIGTDNDENPSLHIESFAVTVDPVHMMSAEFKTRAKFVHLGFALTHTIPA